MEKRIHLYVSRKHPALWLTGLLMLASVVARIVVFSQVQDAPCMAADRMACGGCDLVCADGFF